LVGAGCSVDRWELVAERGVSPVVVVVCLPVAAHHRRLRQWPEHVDVASNSPRGGARCRRPTCPRASRCSTWRWLRMSSRSGESRSRVATTRRA